MVDDEKNFVTCSWSDSAADGWLPRPGAFGRGCGLGFDVHFGLDTLTLLRTLVLLSLLQGRGLRSRCRRV